LWEETIDAHRRAVSDAVLDAAAALVAVRGLASVSMSAVAQRAGIGRATLYKYFPDVDAILAAWHERQVAGHLEQLRHVHEDGDSGQRLHAVLLAYASMGVAHAGMPGAAVLHQGGHVAAAHEQVQAFVEELLAAGVRDGVVRDDVAPAELARFCLHALAAAAGMASKAAVGRLVTVTLDGVRPTRSSVADPR